MSLESYAELFTSLKVSAGVVSPGVVNVVVYTLHLAVPLVGQAPSQRAHLQSWRPLWNLATELPPAEQYMLT